jgi:Mg-chelatase subunit ChlD
MKSILLPILCCLATPLCSQQPISIPVIVVGGDQSPISLKANDLKVAVNDQTVTVMSVSSLAEEHLQYVLLNDQSGRTRWPNGIEQQTDAAAQLLKRVVAPGLDIGSLVNFGDDVYIDVQNSHDPDEIAAKMVRKGIGATRMYDAVVSAANWLAKQPSSPHQRKLIFLFSDGDDNGSKTNLRKAAEALQKGRIPIFVIAPSSIERKKEGEHLRQLASEAGGRAYFLPRNTEQISFEFIKRDLARSFLITVNLPSAEGLLPLTITDVTNPQVSIASPAQIAAP